MPETADDIDLALPRPAAPSPTQSHGTVMVALLCGFVVLAVLLWLSVRGVGPFTGSIVKSEPVPGEKAKVTLTVTNDGSKAGHGKCRVRRLAGTGDFEADFVFLSERVAPHQTVTQSVEVPLRTGSSIAGIDC